MGQLNLGRLTLFSWLTPAMVGVQTDTLSLEAIGASLSRHVHGYILHALTWIDRIPQVRRYFYVDVETSNRRLCCLVHIRHRSSSVGRSSSSSGLHLTSVIQTVSFLQFYGLTAAGWLDGCWQSSSLAITVRLGKLKVSELSEIWKCQKCQKP